MEDASILIVDDEQDFLDSALRMLRISGYPDVTAVSDPAAVAGLLPARAFDVAFLDVTMPGLDGVEVLSIIKEGSPATECVMVTANDSIPTVVRAIRRGAVDYLLKPITPDQLVHALDRALEHRHLVETLALRSRGAAGRALKDPAAFSAFCTGEKCMLRVLHEAELHAASGIPVLITGETGTGKELLARAVHAASRRRGGPFVAVNMLSLSPTLFESEFFGHAKGAFTGADHDRAGYLAQARGGTLFLDEIGDLSTEIQGKLLRILQEGEFVPVGKTKPEQADVRFVAATNCQLETLVAEKRFRKDLYYRLLFAQLQIPPLRERREDIPLLSATFVEGAHKAGVKISDDAEASLLAYDWPGNVRELKGVIESAANLAEDGVIHPGHLPISGRLKSGAPQKAAAAGLEPLAEVERRHILSVYEASGKNKTRAAQVLGIGLQTMHRKLKEFGMD
ncbi:MAG: sigma-54-dependent Fis family transcriptional regulator [Deltaproteobacteria bacterium]|nr:sigma-54-dependent Fis family transcriptional regulator [Deltaproteobacteria bacterium]